MRQKKLTNSIILLLLLVSLVSCDIFGVHQGETENNEDADIVLGERVYDIHLGDSIKHIEKIYARPDTLLLSFLSGVYRSWYGYQYTSGKLSGVELYLYTEKKGYEKVMEEGVVDWISLKPKLNSRFRTLQHSFQGETKDGIGLGSDKASVRKALGEPASTLTEGIDYQVWFYCKEVYGQKNEIQINIEDDSVFFIGFGYYLPIDDPEGKDCVWENH